MWSIPFLQMFVSRCASRLRLIHQVDDYKVLKLRDLFEEVGNVQANKKKMQAGMEICFPTTTYFKLSSKCCL